MLTTLSPIVDISDIKCESYDGFERPKRKRQRLDHLSQEEKMMRRKLKNRMAAQTARDRKKVKMQDLEEEVTLLAKERNMLLNQNSALRLKNASLEQENKELMKRLGQKQSIEVHEVRESHEWSEAIESAELFSGPQQKEQVTLPSMLSLKTIVRPLMMLFVYSSLIKNLTIFSTFFTYIQKNYSTQTFIKSHKSRQLITLNASKCHHNWNQLKT